MYCCICKKIHSIDGLIKCDLFLTSSISKYTNLKTDLLMDDIKKYKSRHSCDICNKIFTTITNYKYHVEHNVCNKIKVSRKKEIKCDICEKVFTDKRSLIYHQNKVVCEKNQEITKLQPLKTNNQQIITTNNINNTNSNNTNNINNSNNNISNNNTQNNITNNIKLVPYDDIKYDYMSESVLRKAFEVPGEAFQSITTDIFFDPDNKENHVIYCPNLNNNQIHVFNGNKFTDGWDVLDKKKFFKEMLTKQMNTLEQIFKCNEEDDNPLEIDNIVGFTNLLKEFNKNNDVIKEYTNILNNICYRKKHIVKNTIDETKEESKDKTKDLRIKAMLARAALKHKDNDI